MQELRRRERRADIAARGPLILTASAALWVGCGGPSPPPKAADAGDPSPCPAGQRFDGEYCVPTGEVIAAGGAPMVTSGSGGSPQAPAAAGALGSETLATGGALSGGAASGGAASGGGSAEAEPTLATPVDITMAAAAGPMVQYVASTHLPAGSRPFGAPFAGQFQEGQLLLQRLQVNPLACYTVIAFGPSPIEDIRVGFYAVDVTRPLSVAATPLLEETEVGSQAVLGRKEQCFKPAPDQRDLWLVVSVERGRGVVAAQVFQKEPSAR